MLILLFIYICTTFVCCQEALYEYKNNSENDSSDKFVGLKYVEYDEIGFICYEKISLHEILYFNGTQHGK